MKHTPGSKKLLDEELMAMSTQALKSAIIQGLIEVLDLVKFKPHGWEDKLDGYEGALRALHSELVCRGEK